MKIGIVATAVALYTSPGGEHMLLVPELARPGMRIEERIGCTHSAAADSGDRGRSLTSSIILRSAFLAAGCCGPDLAPMNRFPGARTARFEIVAGRRTLRRQLRSSSIARFERQSSVWVAPRDRGCVPSGGNGKRRPYESTTHPAPESRLAAQHRGALHRTESSASRPYWRRAEPPIRSRTSPRSAGSDAAERTDHAGVRDLPLRGPAKRAQPAAHRARIRRPLWRCNLPTDGRQTKSPIGNSFRWRADGVRRERDGARADRPPQVPVAGTDEAPHVPGSGAGRESTGLGDGWGSSCLKFDVANSQRSWSWRCSRDAEGEGAGEGAAAPPEEAVEPCSTDPAVRSTARSRS